METYQAPVPSMVSAPTPPQDSGATAPALTSWADIVQQDESDQAAHAATHDSPPQNPYKAEERELERYPRLALT